MGSMTNYLENAILGHIANNSAFTSPTAVYSALFTLLPSDSTSTGEVTNASSGYTRVATAFSTPGVTATGQVANTAAVNFVTVAAGDSITVLGWGLSDGVSQGSGNLLYWATVTSTTLQVGDQATFPVGNITITQD